jgi:Trypsin-like peptidase domain
LALFIGGALFQTPAIAGNDAQYIVDGLPLGDPVVPKSATYREYNCRPSEQFESFIWCKRRRTENSKFGKVTSVNSILHSLDNTSVYISRYIEPAYFAPGDIEREIERLSQRFGAAPHILKQSGSQWGVIAYWGDVTLTPLDTRSLAQLAAGQSVTKGMLFDFLGNFGDSAREGFPVFQLGGAAGYVWGARFDESGKGSLRMTAIDASQFTAPSSVAHGGDIDTGRSVDHGNAPALAPQPKVDRSSGTGFFVNNEGDVFTNNHVIKDCTAIGVFMGQMKQVDAREIARDTTNDLALLSTSLRPPRVAAPRRGLRLGESVAAFGYPYADILATSGNFTQGNVTALAFDGSVHSLDLSVGPGVLRFGQPMVDIAFGAGEFESVSAEEFASCDGLFDLAGSQATAAEYREMDTVIGKNRMDLVGHGRDKMAEELGGCGRFLMQFDKREFRRSIDGDKKMELAFFGPHFGNVDVEEADRIGLELLLRRLAPLDIRQLADAVALQTAVQRGSCQMRDGRLQRVEAIIER